MVYAWPITPASPLCPKSSMPQVPLALTCTRSHRFHRGDLKRMQAIIFSDRHIISNDEPVRAEMIASLIGLIAADIIAKGPSSARLTHQMADIVGFVRTKANNAAKVMILVPQIGIDPAIGIERCHESVADQSASGGMALFAREFQTNAPEGRRELGPVKLFGVIQMFHAILLALSPRVDAFCRRWPSRDP